MTPPTTITAASTHHGTGMSGPGELLLTTAVTLPLQDGTADNNLAPAIGHDEPFEIDLDFPVAKLMHLPESLHVLLRMVLDNDLTFLHLAMQAYLHIHHPILLSDWLAQSQPSQLAFLAAHSSPLPMTSLPTHVPPASSTGYLPPSLACDFPPRPRLPPPTTTCPPVSAADVDGFCMEPQMPTFGQRMEASLVHAVSFCDGASSSSRASSSPTLTSNFPGQLSVWSSSNFNRPKSRSVPVPAGLSVVGRDALILRYIDLDPNEPVLQEQEDENDTDDENDGNLQQQDRERVFRPLSEFARAASEYHDQGGSALAAYVGSLIYCIHIPLDRVARITLLRPQPTQHRSPHLTGTSPRDSATTIDTELDEGEWIEPPVSGQDTLVLDLAAPPTFSVHSACTLSRYYSPRETDDWTPNAAASSARRWILVGEQDEFTSLIARIPSRVPLLSTATAPLPLSYTPGPVRAWWSWSDLVALTNRTAAPMAHLCERCSLVPSPTALNTNTSSAAATHASHARRQAPSLPSISSPPPRSPLRPRSSSTSTCDCCGGDLSTPDTSFNAAATDADTDAVSVDSATDVSDDELVEANALQQRGPRPLLLSSNQRHHHEQHPRQHSGRTADPSHENAAMHDDLDAPAVTLHALPSPTLVRQVIEDSGLSYSVVLPESSPPTLVSTCVTPEDMGTKPLITLSVSDALAELKVDLGMSADLRARERLEENLIARRQILNLLYLYGLLPDHPDDHPPTDLLHTESRTFPQRNHLLGTLKPIFTSCFTDFLNFTCNPAILGEILNELPAHCLLRNPPPQPTLKRRTSESAPISPVLLTPPASPSVRNLAVNGGVGGIASAPASTIGLSNSTSSQTAATQATSGTRRPSITAAAFSRRMSASLANIARGRRRSSVTSEAPTVLDTPTTPRNESWEAQQQQRPLDPPHQPTKSPHMFYSLCRGCDVSSDVVWHCSLCRTCVSIDHHHCPACNQCVYVPGPSSLPQFRPVPATPDASDDHFVSRTHSSSGAENINPTHNDASTRPSRISFAPEPTRNNGNTSAPSSSIDSRRRLASLRTGVRASVHYHHCPNCAHTNDQVGVLLKAPADTVHARLWADLNWAQWVLEQVSPDAVDDAVSTAQSVVSSLVYLAIGQVAPVFGLAELARGSMLSTVPEGWNIEEGAWSDDTDCDDDSPDRPHPFAQASPAGTTITKGASPKLTINTSNILPPAHASGSISAPPSATVATPGASPHPAPISLIKDPATGVLRRNHVHHSSMSSFSTPPPIVGGSGSAPSTPQRGVLPKVLSTEDLVKLDESSANGGGYGMVPPVAGDASSSNGLAGSRKSWEPVHLRPGVIAYPTTTTTTTTTASTATRAQANMNGGANSTR